MNNAKITRATKALQRLETAQDKFNAAIDELTDEEVVVWVKANGVTFEPSKSKERIDSILKPAGEVTPRKL
jgi:hypothetical protein